jgi:SH3-like domain-containing protein
MKTSMILGCAGAAAAGVFAVWQVDMPVPDAAVAAAPPAMRVMYVAAQSATCRDGKGGTGKSVSKLALGDQINIVAENAGWSQVEFSGDLRCWTATAVLSPNRPSRSAPPRPRADAVSANVDANTEARVTPDL